MEWTNSMRGRRLRDKDLMALLSRINTCRQAWPHDAAPLAWSKIGIKKCRPDSRTLRCRPKRWMTNACFSGTMTKPMCDGGLMTYCLGSVGSRGKVPCMPIKADLKL